MPTKKISDFNAKLKAANLPQNFQQVGAINSASAIGCSGLAMRKPYSVAECKALLAGFLDGVEFAVRISGRDAYITVEVRSMMVDLGGHLRRLEEIDAVTPNPKPVK